MIKMRGMLAASKTHATARGIVHVAHQDPKGGEHVALLVLCRDQIEMGLDVRLITPCVAGELPMDYTRLERAVQVVRLQGREGTGPAVYGLDTELRHLQRQRSRSTCGLRRNLEPL